jgi:hypothetical protein
VKLVSKLFSFSGTLSLNGSNFIKKP